MDQAVSVYVDHVFHSRSRMIEAGLFDINTVEVLKGPQGTHLGLNTTAGAFVMQTRGAVLNSNDGMALLTYGDNQQVIGQWAQNMALSSESAFRVAAKLGTDDGFWRMRSDAFPEADANSGTQTSAVRLSGIWQPNEVFSASAKVEYQRIEKDNPFAWQPGGCHNLYGQGLSSQTELNAFWAQTGSQNDNPLRVPVTCREDFIDNEFDRYSPSSPFNRSEFEYFISNLQLNWQWQNTQVWWNSAWFNMNYGFSGNDLSHGTSAQRLFYSTDDNQQFSQEVRLITPLSSSAALTAGGYWHRGITDYVTADADGRNQQNPRFVQSTANQTETRTSVFAQLEWHLLSDVTLDLGYRWSRTNKDFNGEENRAQFNQLPQQQRDSFVNTLFTDTQASPARYADFAFRTTAEFNNRSTRFNDNMPSLALIYRFSPQWMSYYKWSKAAKSGGFNFRLNNLDEADLVYQPEEVIAHEIGLKANAMNGRLQLALSLFNSNYYNLQQNSNRGDDGVISGSTIRNIAKAESNGVELDVRYALSSQWSVAWLASWLDAEFTRYPGADCTRLQSVVANTDVANAFGVSPADNGNGTGNGGANGNGGGNGGGQTCSQDLSGKSMHMAPDFASTFTLQHQWRVAEGYTLSSQLEWFYSDGFFTSPHADLLRYQTHFNKLNFNTTIQPDNAPWQLAIGVRNLTNKLTSRQLGQDGNAAVSALLDPPRTWAVQFRYQY